MFFTLRPSPIADTPRRQQVRRNTAAFTLLEVVIAMCILMIFFVSSTMSLNLFDDRASKNRNAEAARAVVDDYINFLLNDSTAAPAATSAGTDIDGDGIPDGVQCTAISGRAIPSAIPLVVARNSTAAPVVVGTLYWNCQPVGIAYGLTNNTDLMQVNFLLAYTWRNQTYYYKAITFKATT